MFYAIGYQKIENSKRKITVTTKETKARSLYEKFKTRYYRVCLLKYGSSAADYIILAQSENGKEVAEQCQIENAEE